MVDNLQLEPLSVQFCGELMSQVHIDMCSIIDISNPYLTVKRKAAQITRSSAQGPFARSASPLLSQIRKGFGTFISVNFIPFAVKSTDSCSWEPGLHGCRSPRFSSTEWATKSFLGPLSFCNFNLTSGHFPGLKAKVGLVWSLK